MHREIPCPADSSVLCGMDRGHAVAFSWLMSWSGGSGAASLPCLALWQGWPEGWAGPVNKDASVGSSTWPQGGRVS